MFSAVYRQSPVSDLSHAIRARPPLRIATAQRVYWRAVNMLVYLILKNNKVRNSISQTGIRNIMGIS